jgi:hypothetical protein
MGTPRTWTPKMNERRAATMRAAWRDKSRRELFREIIASNGGADQLLLGPLQVVQLLGLERRFGNYRHTLDRLVAIGELPVAGFAGSRRRFRLDDVLALKSRAREEER